jgi:hypothetical protein
VNRLREPSEGMSVKTMNVLTTHDVAKRCIVLYLLFFCFFLIWFDFFAHLTSLIPLGFQIGGPFGFEHPLYEVYWSVYWGTVSIAITILTIIHTHEWFKVTH